jgi:hypothetical protein
MCVRRAEHTMPNWLRAFVGVNPVETRWKQSGEAKRKIGPRKILSKVLEPPMATQFWRLDEARCSRFVTPVTPEVAGSSPVAPAKVPANRHVVLSDLTPDRRRLHGLFSKRCRKRQKRPEMRSQSDDFKPIQAEFRPATKAACDYTKRPEVTAAATRRCRCSPLGRLAPEPDAHER